MAQAPLQHLAIICDGNRRWAKRHHLPELAGHRHAVETTMDQLIDACLLKKIPYLTFWVFSTENWHRGKTWVDQYFNLLRLLFDKHFSRLNQKNVRLHTIGNLFQLPKDVQKLFSDWTAKTKTNTKLNLIIAINYGGRDDILRAVKKHGVDFPQHLDTSGFPDPDLLIRTGENNTRLSGFMLWQLAYTQLYFTNTLFPDFTPKELDKTLSWYQQQTQNLGK
ncbi:MAG: polyprenyl diphosphate synthase [Candidatus Beckwithbacteria bacterium]